MGVSKDNSVGKRTTIVVSKLLSSYGNTYNKDQIATVFQRCKGVFGEPEAKIRNSTEPMRYFLASFIIDVHVSVD